MIYALVHEKVMCFAVYIPVLDRLKSIMTLEVYPERH